MHLFLFATIANDLHAYGAMRESMAAVGFTDENCRFQLFDNSAGNHFEPYQVLRDLRGDGNEPYVILCHQDILFTDESSAHVLSKVLDDLDRDHPRWALAGPAGVDRWGRFVMHMDDPTGSTRQASEPKKVLSMDECFLAMRRADYLMVSPNLSGFHFYGCDLGLNAFAADKDAYVIPFAVHHLSSGNAKSEAFSQCREAIIATWRPRLLWGIVRTTCSDFRISSVGWIESAINTRLVGALLRITVPIVLDHRWRSTAVQR